MRRTEREALVNASLIGIVNQTIRARSWTWDAMGTMIDSHDSVLRAGRPGLFNDINASGGSHE
jgi:hypothetical protein